jgi:enoyl-CoA hydratase
MSSPVTVTHEGHVTVIRINRPHVRNAVDLATAQALREAWQAFDADANARVGILTGGDEVFCAGADLKAVDELLPHVQGTTGPLGFTRLSVSKPTIAAIAGYCVAGGLELACWCDMRVADESAIFGCFERRFGVPLIDGGTVRLPQIVGLGRALEMILTGRAVHVEEAHRWGLINALTPRGAHLAHALELAQTLASFPQACLRNDRASVYGALGLPATEALQQEADFGMATVQSGETQHGASEFRAGKGRKGARE